MYWPILLVMAIQLNGAPESVVESVSLSFNPSFLHHHLHSPSSRTNKQTQTLRQFFQPNGGDDDEEDSSFMRPRQFFPPISSNRRHETSATQQKSKSPPALIDTRTNNQTNNRYSNRKPDDEASPSSLNKITKHTDLSKVDLIPIPVHKSNKPNEYVPVISTRNEWDSLLFGNERRAREMPPLLNTGGNSYRPKSVSTKQSDTNNGNSEIPTMLMGNNFFGDNDFGFGQFLENPNNRRNKNSANYNNDNAVNKHKKLINTNSIPNFQRRRHQQPTTDSNNNNDGDDNESDFDDIFKMDDFPVMPF